MKTIATLLLLGGCATTRADDHATAPAVQAERAEAQRLAAELEASLANPPPVVAEPTPPDPVWVGYMVVNPDSVPPAVAILFAEGGIISDETLANGIALRAAIASSDGGYWLYPVTRGALIFRAVRVYNDGRVTVEMPLHGEYDGTTIVVAAGILDNPSDATTYRPCSVGVCGHLRKAANRIVDCEGPGCTDLVGQ
ncbi:hypothetical protein HY635_03930 [Candidatus Uhrbacteria bacterium]|nr:hypothetical protein [Candidatus Uhrbacteria bacterium]